ncbi:MAG TPA: acyltransferase [Pyrinomonadaceae bacterium]|jgi:peptidoglycan/LPS O-acetylase OafA/YrhL
MRIGERLARIYELGNVNSPDRNLPMEGLRGFAVLLVFFVHYHALFKPWLAAHSYSFAVSEFVGTIGLSGVDLFFVLSGYLIYGWTIRKYSNYAKFIRRRIERIYPTFLCVFAVYLVLSALYPAESRIPAEPLSAGIYLVENVLLLPGVFDIHPVITVSWSLSYEFFFYLFIPLLVVGLRMRRWPGRQRVIFFLILAFLYTVYCYVGTSYGRIHFIMFISGILLFEATYTYELDRRVTGRIDYAVYIILALIFPLYYAFAIMPEVFPFLPHARSLNENYRMILLFGGFWIFTLAAFSPRTLSSRIFAWTPLRWLGNISYSYYLIHGLTLKIIAVALMRLPLTPSLSLAAFWLGLPVFFFLTLVSSTLLFILVERRFSIPPVIAAARQGKDASAVVVEGTAGVAAAPARSSDVDLQPIGAWPVVSESENV